MSNAQLPNHRSFGFSEGEKYPYKDHTNKYAATGRKHPGCVTGQGDLVLEAWLISPDEVHLQVGPEREGQQPKTRVRSVSGGRSGRCKGWR